MRDPEDRYELFLQVADDDDQGCLYSVEHWFADRPEHETVVALFEEAKRGFEALYPDVEHDDYAVEIRRLRPTDNHRPAALPVRD